MKLLNKKNIINTIIKILVFLIILIAVKNNIDRNNMFSIVEDTPYSQGSTGRVTNSYKKVDPRLVFSQQIALSNPEIQMMEDRSCGKGASLENRKRLRWMVKVNEFKVYQYVYENISILGPYYLFIVFYSLLLLSTILFVGRIIPLHALQYFIFVCGVLYIFQFKLSEISYSVLELFFISVALYSSHRKNILLLIVTTIFAIHNRESGIILPFAWLLFNRSKTPIFLSLSLSIFIWLGLSNFDIAYCFLKSDFLMSFTPQDGQIGFWSLNNNSVSVVSFSRLIVEGYVVPIVALYMLYKSSIVYNKKEILVACLVYALIFLVATPILHHSVKMLFIPFMVILSSKKIHSV